MDDTINASDVQIHVQPAASLTVQRHDLISKSMPLLQAVSGQWMSRKYDNLGIRCLCAIYDRTTDRMVVHVP